MTILTKIQTLFRANLREAAQTLTDANAVRIYRQEIVDAQNLLARRKGGLAAMIASRKDLENEIAGAKSRAEKQEQAIKRIPPDERSDKLLLMAATDIAAAQTLADELGRRHVELSQRINAEEVTLRKLITEIREHSRELKLLKAQISSTNPATAPHYENSVAAQLATLRESRASLSSAASTIDTSEASMEEMLERVDASPFEREIRNSGKSDRELLVNSVLSRLKAIDKPG